jgi:hypothetical protein
MSSSMSSSSSVRVFAASVYRDEAQNPIPRPLTHCIYVYSTLTVHIYAHREVGGGELNQREG